MSVVYMLRKVCIVLPKDKASLHVHICKTVEQMF